MDAASMLVTVQHELGSGLRKQTSKRLGVPEGSAFRLAAGVYRVVDQQHTTETATA